MNHLRNQVQLIGNLGMDPDVKSLTNGKVRAQFRVATSESYKNSSGERVTETQWHTVVAWGKTAEYVENNLKKGTQVALEGKLIHRTYEPEEGTKRYITEIVAQEIMKLDKKEKEPVS